ncbi:MAG: hypothetical protein HY232_06385 [Acidobacteria bacterium]|nr:hypothetical protein [Acidobacteriota bacterium]
MSPGAALRLPQANVPAPLWGALEIGHFKEQVFPANHDCWRALTTRRITMKLGKFLRSDMWSVVMVHMSPLRGLGLKAGSPCYKHVAPTELTSYRNHTTGKPPCVRSLYHDFHQ